MHPHIVSMMHVSTLMYFDGAHAYKCVHVHTHIQVNLAEYASQITCILYNHTHMSHHHTHVQVSLHIIYGYCILYMYIVYMRILKYAYMCIHMYR